MQVSLPLRLGGAFNAGRCDPQTSAGIVANETASGCGSARDNALLVPAPASSPGWRCLCLGAMCSANRLQSLLRGAAGHCHTLRASST